MEPMTIGALVASTLGIAGEALLKGGLSEAAKDGYKVLKGIVASWAGSDVEALEKTPGSAPRRAVVAEAIDARTANEQATARALAQRLIAALKEAGGGPVGLDVGRLDALAVELGNITVTEGTGARIEDARVLGTFKTGNIDVGEPQPKK
jgi:hypothetical protein